MHRLPVPALQEARRVRVRQRGAVRLCWKFLGSRNDGKEHPGRGNPYGFAFAIQPLGQPLAMFGAGTGTTRHAVRDGAAGLAVPCLIERDRATLSGPIDDLMRHRPIPTGRNIAAERNPKNCANYQRGLGGSVPDGAAGSGAPYRCSEYYSAASKIVQLRFPFRLSARFYFGRFCACACLGTSALLACFAFQAGRRANKNGPEGHPGPRHSC